MADQDEAPANGMAGDSSHTQNVTDGTSKDDLKSAHTGSPYENDDSLHRSNTTGEQHILTVDDAAGSTGRRLENSDQRNITEAESASGSTQRSSGEPATDNATQGPHSSHIDDHDADVMMGDQDDDSDPPPPSEWELVSFEPVETDVEMSDVDTDGEMPDEPVEAVEKPDAAAFERTKNEIIAEFAEHQSTLRRRVDNALAGRKYNKAGSIIANATAESIRLHKRKIDRLRDLSGTFTLQKTNSRTYDRILHKRRVIGEKVKRRDDRIAKELAERDARLGIRDRQACMEMVRHLEAVTSHMKELLGGAGEEDQGQSLRDELITHAKEGISLAITAFPELGANSILTPGGQGSVGGNVKTPSQASLDICGDIPKDMDIDLWRNPDPLNNRLILKELFSTLQYDKEADLAEWRAANVFSDEGARLASENAHLECINVISGKMAPQFDQAASLVKERLLPKYSDSDVPAYITRAVAEIISKAGMVGGGSELILATEIEFDHYIDKVKAIFGKGQEAMEYPPRPPSIHDNLVDETVQVGFIGVDQRFSKDELRHIEEETGRKMRSATPDYIDFMKRKKLSKSRMVQRIDFPDDQALNVHVALSQSDEATIKLRKTKPSGTSLLRKSQMNEREVGKPAHMKIDNWALIPVPKLIDSKDGELNHYGIIWRPNLASSMARIIHANDKKTNDAVRQYNEDYLAWVMANYALLYQLQEQGTASNSYPGFVQRNIEDIGKPLDIKFIQVNCQSNIHVDTSLAILRKVKQSQRKTIFGLGNLAVGNDHPQNIAHLNRTIQAYAMGGY